MTAPQRAGTTMVAGATCAWILPIGLLSAYPVVKLVYEEFVLCFFVDPRYRGFAPTQYQNLFGWEF
jgi:hypothetical protein